MTGLAIGQRFPEIVRGPIDRTTLALFAGASGDHAPMHLDIDAAHRAGMNDVFVHGMLLAAYLGQALKTWVGSPAVRTWGVRFVAVTPVNSTVQCIGEVEELGLHAGEDCARLKLGVRLAEDELVVSGHAWIALAALELDRNEA